MEKSYQEMLKDLYETVITFPQENSTAEEDDGFLSWEKFRKALGRIEVDWDNLGLDRTLVPLRVWIKAEIENNIRKDDFNIETMSVEFDEFYSTLIEEVTDLEENVLEAVKIFRDLDLEQSGCVSKMELKSALENSASFSWEQLGVYDTSVVDSHLFSFTSISENEDGGPENVIRFEHFFNLLVQVAGQTLVEMSEDEEDDEEDDESFTNDFFKDIDFESVIDWTADEVGEWLFAIGFPQYVEIFKLNRVNGHRLLTMPSSHLPKLRVQQWDHIKAIVSEIKKLRQRIPSHLL